MDIRLAQTFLAIAAAGSFLRASERLHVTQTAVSARVRQLEDSLGVALFVRNKAGAALTPAGERFLRFAQMLVQVWERARHQVSVPPGRRALVTLGCEMNLWDPLLVDWLLWMREAAPQLAVRTEVGTPEALLDKVLNGVLDVAVLYAPQARPGLKVELLIEEKLVLVTTARDAKGPRSANYIFVDWSAEFASQHHLAFPGLANAPVVVGLGPLGREYLLQAGGSGYFRLSVVRGHLRSGRLRLVRDAPVFLHPAYAVYSESADPKIINPAVSGLRKVVGEGLPETRPRRRAPAAKRQFAGRGAR